MEHILEPLPRQPLEEVLEPEMAKQYRIRRGAQCKFMPVFAGERWLCSCGQENTVGENCGCGLDPEPLTRQVLEELSRDAATRLEQEELTRDQREAEAKQAAERKKRKKILRRVLTAAACVVGLALLVMGGFAFLRFGLPALRYNQALDALESGDYQKAHRLFVLAGNYQDAEAYVARFYTPVLKQTGVTFYNEEARFEDDQLPEEARGSLEFTYDSVGRLQAIRKENMQSDWQEPERVTYANTYDEAGNMLVKENSYGKTVCEYDAYGSVRKEDHYTAEGTHDYSKIFVIQYDAQGRVVESTEVCSDHVLVNYSYEQHLVYTYDAAGRLVKQLNDTNFPATSESNYSTTITWEYNDRGDMVRMESKLISPDETEDNCNETNTWEYDDRGRLVKQVVLMEYPNNPLADYRLTRTCTYDQNGETTSDVTLGEYPNDTDRNYEESWYRTYDAEGRLTEERYQISYKGKDRNLFAGRASVETYIYDTFGRVKEKSEVMDYMDEDHSYTKSTTYTYAFDGRLKTSKEIFSAAPGGKAGDSYEAVTTYNENALPQSVTTTTAGSENTREYTYGYYYYPEGEALPDNEFLFLGIVF